jgi:hypothetical protein
MGWLSALEAALGTKGCHALASSRCKRLHGLAAMAPPEAPSKPPHRYSGRMSVAACSKAVVFSPARWHSITVEVRIGTTCLGNLPGAGQHQGVLHGMANYGRSRPVQAAT